MDKPKKKRGQPAKKRRKPGRPPKKRPEDTREYWDKQLHHHRLGKNRAEPKWRVLGCTFVNKNGETLSLESVLRDRGTTRQTDSMASLYQQRGADESIVLPAPWLRYLEYMDIIAELQSPEDRGGTLKQLILEDARSRCGEEQPIDFSCAGTPEEFRALCAEHDVKVQVKFPIINIIGYPLPSDKP